MQEAKRVGETAKTDYPALKTKEVTLIICGADFPASASAAATVADAFPHHVPAWPMLVSSMDAPGESPKHDRSRLMNGHPPRLGRVAERSHTLDLSFDEKRLQSRDESVAQFVTHSAGASPNRLRTRRPRTQPTLAKNNTANQTHAYQQ